MNDEYFERIAEVFGFAPSRALRELLEAAMRAENGQCARIAADAEPHQAADLIRARWHNSAARRSP